MSDKKHKPRTFRVEAMKLVQSDPELAAKHASLSDQGYTLAPSARCYRRQNKTMTVQINWTRRRLNSSSSYTVTIRGL